VIGIGREEIMPEDTVSVLIDFDLPDELTAEIAALSPRLCVRQVDCHSPEEVERALAEGVEVLYARLLPASLKSARNLRWVQFQSAGIDSVTSHPLMGSDILLTTTSGAHAVPAAEYIMGAMIALGRGFPTLVRDAGRREWNRQHSRERDLTGKTMLILGYGSIGREAARLASAFHMRILATKSNPLERQDPGFIYPGVGDPEGNLPERIVGNDALLDILPEADFVACTLPLTSQTKGRLGEREFRAMKPSAFFINMSRGGVCDEPSLIRALRENWIAGAALDVFVQEPLPVDSPFYDLTNVLITPHISASRDNPKYDQRATAIFIENLRRYLAGRPLINLVDKGKEY
jgi:phosphoglycerate dehydrogenase-like enzyme